METKQESTPDGAIAGPAPPLAAAPVPNRQKLPAKGSCWYCERPLDSVRRFCGKDCASAFEEEAQYSPPEADLGGGLI